MQASTLTELLNFEGNVEAAFSQWLSDQSVELLRSQSWDTLDDNFTAVSFSLGATTEHAHFFDDGSAEYDQYACDIAVTIRTLRHGEIDSQTTGVSSRHQELVAIMRTWFLVSKVKASDLEDYLRFYEFQFLLPTATEYESEGDYDETTLNFSGQISILPNSWPSS